MPSLDRVISTYKSDLSHSISINKTYKLNQSYYKKNYVNKYSFSNSVPLPITNKDITFNGVSLKYTGSEGLLDEFKDKDGNSYTKDRVSGEVKKKLKIVGYARLNSKTDRYF